MSTLVFIAAIVQMNTVQKVIRFFVAPNEYAFFEEIPFHFKPMNNFQKMYKGLEVANAIEISFVWLAHITPPRRI